jgi:hypothetical protein
MHGLCVEKSDKQLLEVRYKQGVKDGPYRKRVGQDYEEEGVFVNGQRHGVIKIRKGNESAAYLFDNGNRGEEVPV